MATSRVQLALNVSDLDEAARFCEQLFGVVAAKRRPELASTDDVARAAERRAGTGLSHSRSIAGHRAMAAAVSGISLSPRDGDWAPALRSAPMGGPEVTGAGAAGYLSEPFELSLIWKALPW